MNLGPWVSKNLIAILGMLATLATGYFAGISKAAEVERTTTEHEGRIEALETGVKEQRSFHECIKMAVVLGRIDPKSPIPCELKVPE